MTEAELIDLARESMIVFIKMSAPALIIGLAVGLLISLIQTLTQIMEQTITFVPKFIATGAAILFFGSFMLQELINFTRQLMDRIISGGVSP